MPGAASVPCLTILCHPDLTRVGQRCVLNALLVRQPVQVSRGQCKFAEPGAGDATPLGDPFLSRKPVSIKAGRKGQLVVESCRAEVRIDGEALGGRCELQTADLRRGVVIELSRRIALLLHLSSNPAQSEVGGIAGASDAIERVRREIVRVAPREVSVLVRGETGVGKELVAQAIHAGSARADRPLLALNMATLNESTAASALFGHLRGAFTGAERRHAGVFERADGGTLFLDEIGETPSAVQPMLLRAIETGCITPLGSERDVRVDVRIVAATDAPLERDVEAGSFRAALMHRLAGYDLEVPPLRERRDDVARLVLRFLREELETLDRVSLLDTTAQDERPSLPAAVMAQLVRHEYPGNVRELRNLVRQLALASLDEERLHLPERLQQALRTARGAEPTGQDGERPGGGKVTPGGREAKVSDEVLLATLRESGWSPERAATALGIAKSTVHYYMRRSPLVRRASDIEDAELQQCAAEHARDVDAMAEALRVSPRALRMTLRQRGMLEA